MPSKRKYFRWVAVCAATYIVSYATCVLLPTTFWHMVPLAEHTELLVGNTNIPSSVVKQLKAIIPMPPAKKTEPPVVEYRLLRIAIAMQSPLPTYVQRVLVYSKEEVRVCAKQLPTLQEREFYFVRFTNSSGSYWEQQGVTSRSRF